MPQAGDSISLFDVTGDTAAHEYLAEVYDLDGLQQLATAERAKTVEGASPSTP